MQGDFEAPPIIVLTSRWKAVALFLGCACFVGIAVFLIATDGGSFISYMTGGFFALGLPLAIWRLRVPARLEMSPQGLIWFTGKSDIIYSWHEFTSFRAYLVSGRSWTKHIGYDLAPDSSKRSKYTSIGRKIAGVDGGFGGGWELKPEAVAILLNQAKARWD
jgi:hypothetical protein